VDGRVVGCVRGPVAADALAKKAQRFASPEKHATHSLPTQSTVVVLLHDAPLVLYGSWYSNLFNVFAKDQSSHIVVDFVGDLCIFFSGEARIKNL
jgi:hypothetical protein